MAMSNIIIVFTHVPDMTSAEAIANALIQTNLAACVNISSPCVSIYQWQGQLERANEYLLRIKTCFTHYAAVQSMIQTHHPYELPECSYIHIDGGDAQYLAWVMQQTT